MKRKLVYLIKVWPAVIVRLVIAFLTVRMSLALYDTITAATSGLWDDFFQSGMWVIIYVVLMLPANVLMTYVQGRFIKGALTKMKTDYIEAVFQKNISEFQKDNNSLYLSALTNDFDLIERDYLEQVMIIIDSLINFAAAVLIIAIVSPWLLLVGAGIAGINIVISMLAERPIKRHNAERSDLMRSYSGFVKEVLSAFQIIKANDLEMRIKNDFKEKSKKVQQKKYVIDKIMSFIFAIQNVNMMITLLGLMLVVAYMTIIDIVTFAGVLVVITNIDGFIGPIVSFSEAIPKMLSVKVLFKRIDESLLNKETYPETESFNDFKEQINLEGVSYGYTDELVIKDVDLTFSRGKKYLIVGPSGGGKSTLLKLLRKYFAPTDGEITIDRIPLKTIKKVDYFGKLANIEQQVFLFEDTLRNNLTLYKDYQETDILDAVKRAGLEDFVLNHPDGLDRTILDNGKNISGGEKSRIAIARGLLNKAPLIFLDEAFASLDLAKAREIEASVLALKNVTVINVSHVIIKENLNHYDEIITVASRKATRQPVNA
jgi:ATP-binding cassette subfamily C protein